MLSMKPHILLILVTTYQWVVWQYRWCWRSLRWSSLPENCESNRFQLLWASSLSLSFKVWGASKVGGSGSCQSQTWTNWANLNNRPTSKSKWVGNLTNTTLTWPLGVGLSQHAPSLFFTKRGHRPWKFSQNVRLVEYCCSWLMALIMAQRNEPVPQLQE